MKPYTRSERVAGQIKKTLSDILARKVKDPRLYMITITSVKMSADLKSARIYFAPSGPQGDKDRAAEGLKSALGFVKRTLARELGLRYMPEIQFFYDDSFDYAGRIDRVLETIDQPIDQEDGPDHTAFENK